ncbi:polysaccharide biosynthesis tyrosine autokinase [Actinomycetospora sp. CA-084318]|uniref:polysaccharide biosynthesis tyrosine autokinase n=1 Tax=Actinomycetospora sp. CA-084318 TaxID=3239892 RepID=UPI003D997ED1
MSLKDIALAARRRWVAVLVLALVGMIVGFAVGMSSPPQYSARTYVYVSGQSTDEGSAYEGSLLAEQKARAYSEIVSSGSFPTRVAAAVGGDPGQIASQVSVSTQSDSSLIEVVATDPAPERAASLADASAAAVVDLVGALERPSPERPGTVTATLVEPAIVPLAPSSTDPQTYVVLGLVLGLVVGLGAAVLWSALDTTVRDSSGLAALTDGPVLGVVPRDPRGGNLVGDADRLSAVAEAFRQVRTSLGFVAITRKLHTVMVTSAVQGEGKSTTAVDLALVLAQQGKRVLAVDADLRRPHLAELFGLPGEVGLTNVLLGQLPLEDAVQPGADGQVSVLGRGPEPPNPADLLTSPAFGGFLQSLAGRYDVVVLDTPPLLPVADAAIMAQRCDGVVLVVRAQKTSGRLVTEAVQRLRDASAVCVGSVLTMVRTDTEKYRYYKPAANGADAAPTSSASPPSSARSRDIDDDTPTVQGALRFPAEVAEPAVTTSELFVERYRPRPRPMPDPRPAPALEATATEAADGPGDERAEPDDVVDAEPQTPEPSEATEESPLPNPTSPAGSRDCGTEVAETPEVTGTVATTEASQDVEGSEISEAPKDSGSRSTVPARASS